jgi:PTH2 family peptidyl-tRNA hydrolase
MEIKNEFDTPELILARKNQGDPWIMYFVVRKSLNMGAGKFAAQIGHAVGMMYKTYINYLADKLSWDKFVQCQLFQLWEQNSFCKIVLEANDNKFEKIKQQLECFVVRDAGLTEVEAGSETVIGLWPCQKSQAPDIIRKLQCLK